MRQRACVELGSERIALAADLGLKAQASADFRRAHLPHEDMFKHKTKLPTSRMYR